MESASTLELNVSLHGHVISYAKLSHTEPRLEGLGEYYTSPPFSPVLEWDLAFLEKRK